MVTHKVVDVEVLSFLGFVNVHFAPKFEVRFELLETVLASIAEFAQLGLEALTHFLKVLCVLLLECFDLVAVGPLALGKLEFESFFVLLKLIGPAFMRVVLILGECVALNHNVTQVVVVLVLEVFDFLQVNAHLYAVVVFHEFHLSILGGDLPLDVEDFVLGDVVERLDCVALELREDGRSETAASFFRTWT